MVGIEEVSDQDTGLISRIQLLSKAMDRLSVRICRCKDPDMKSNMIKRRENQQIEMARLLAKHHKLAVTG